MKTGQGSQHTTPAPKKAKHSGRLKMGRPEVMIKARPRAMLIMAREAMKGGMRILLATMAPLRNPQPRPDNSPRPQESMSPISRSFKHRPVITPAKATTDPTERSMPPVKIT